MRQVARLCECPGNCSLCASGLSAQTLYACAWVAAPFLSYPFHSILLQVGSYYYIFIFENSDENVAKNSEEEENTSKSPDLEENTTKNRLSAIFDRAEKVGSLQRFKTLFTSRDKSAVYDIEVKPKEEFEEISTSEFITHISNHFQIADREFQHQIFEKEELETETTIDFENNLKDFEKCYEIIDQTVEVDNGILTYVNNNLTENFEVEIEEKVADVQKEELEENNLNNSEIQEDLRVEKLDSELENLNYFIFPKR